LRVTVTNDAPASTEERSGRLVAGGSRTLASGTLTWAFIAIAAFDVLVGVYYRFSTTSKMWLDEAQSVNIARLPLGELHRALRRDGAPPLYYVLLHYWMQVVGTSDAQIRALSGLFGVLALPLMWWIVRRGFGKIESWAALGILAASPFAVYYAVEARMYSLLILLATAAIGAAMALMAKATLPRAALVALIATALVYTHYWSWYLLVVAGCWWAWVVVRGTTQRRRSALYGLGALAVAAVAFVPWVPTFMYQRAHTGTPWASAPTLASVFGWVAGFVVNQNIQSTNLSLHVEIELLCLLLLAVFGYACTPVGRDRLEFRLAGQPRARVLAFVTVGTLAVGWLASRLAGTAFQPRYSSVIFPMLVVLVALGIVSLPPKWLQVALFATLSVTALWTTHWGAHAQRSQAGRVAKVMAASVPPGSVVVVCPDQLGPSLLRYAGATSYHYVGFPRFDRPDLVNWVDYKHKVQGTSLTAFAHRVVRAAGPDPFFLVWSKGYGYHRVCADFKRTLADVSGRAPNTLLVAKKYVYYQSMNLLEYAPTP
jgi:mannosyltransferase